MFFCAKDFINTSIITKAVDGQKNKFGRSLDVNQKGMSPEHCAHRIVQAIERKKSEAVIGSAEVWSVYLNRYFPQQFNKLMARHPIKQMRKLLFWRAK